MGNLTIITQMFFICSNWTGCYISVPCRLYSTIPWFLMSELSCNFDDEVRGGHALNGGNIPGRTLVLMNFKEYFIEIDLMRKWSCVSQTLKVRIWFNSWNPMTDRVSDRGRKGKLDLVEFPLDFMIWSLVEDIFFWSSNSLWECQGNPPLLAFIHSLPLWPKGFIF